MRAGHADVGLVGRALGQDLLVGGGHVGMGAENSGGAAVDAVTCALDRGATAAQITAAENFITSQSGVAPRRGDQILNFLKLDYRLNDKNSASISVPHTASSNRTAIRLLGLK